MGNLRAHTPNDKGEWHSLDNHLKSVAEKAKEFASQFGAADIAHVLGLLHDLGKANPLFQSYLDACACGQRHEKVPHSIWGAALVYAFIYLAQKDSENWKELSLAIMGHHSGLEDCGRAATKLHHFINNDDSLNQMQAALKSLNLSFPSIKTSVKDLRHDSTRRELFIRMLFSALVDADYLDTEKHFDPEKAEIRCQGPSFEILWKKLATEQDRIINVSTLINRIRKEVYTACLNAAVSAPGVFRLTVPTGGGKTRSSLAFALKHALNNNLTRVIVAIPYTSIIDQTARVFRDILGEDAVLEHHSAVETPDDEEDRQDELFVRHKLATENWDAPLIVTTTVQLFESLFSNRPGKVRKLHRLAGTVIILDEVQMLPPNLLRPIWDVIKDLATPVSKGGYGSTVVLCTATQPAFEDSRWLESFRGMPVHEIVPQYPEHFRKLKRVEYVRCSKAMPWIELARELRNLPQVLMILNTRRDALELITEMGDAPHVLHLSTLLCGAHRKVILKEVRKRLDPRNSLPVCLVSTQVVEAGVDLDFPVVYRAIGPLDRIVQAAGRCNRENRQEAGKVVVFEPADGKVPGGPYRVGLEKAKFLLSENPIEHLHNPELYREYFRRLYDDIDPDVKHIQSYREVLNYPEVASRFRLIEKDTVSVVVPYKDAMMRLAAWEATPNRDAWRALQPYIINLYQYEVKQKCDWLEKLSSRLYKWHGRYDERLGISEGYNDPADLVV